ncbi:MAG: hypothetical protein N2111_06715 [Candidatus Sumerlaeaceae bacterium]|nr:hypothetical protein [Candidatus Sumerlaeaceae bacterium]
MARRLHSNGSTHERLRCLLAAYGSLLTARQRTLLEQHVLGNRSFADIAREHGISRQAVHDAVRKAQRLLESFDSRLGGTLTDAATGPASSSWEAIRDRLDDLRKRVAASGIIYRSDWIVREIGQILDQLPGRPTHRDQI